MADIRQEIERRRTFAIISHPDAGKTTLTEKFLLYGGAIQTAGSVKGKQGDKHAVSDWMELEKQRGISVSSSVMQFTYEGYCINILDTPGHQDFSEDTYRTLMAADSVVMVIDAAKGIEAQTRKLFRVCAMRGIPIFTFINKMDREARDPFDPRFSAFVFKIQANMNKAHRDRIAFMRICSGMFDRNREYYHVQGKKNLKLSQPQQMMAQSREGIDVAYAGDIIGVFDPGIFSIGDTICESGMKVCFGGIPTFAPEHFAYVEQVDSMKRKQFAKGMMQIAQEGAIQIFFEPGGGMERVVVGVVGVLQYDVLKFRMQSEYGVEYRKQDMPHDLIRVVHDPDLDVRTLRLSGDTKWVQDIKGNNLLIFPGEWALRFATENNPTLVLDMFGSNA